MKPSAKLCHTQLTVKKAKSKKCLIGAVDPDSEYLRPVFAPQKVNMAGIKTDW